MRKRTQCEACRRSHLKCVRTNHSNKCQRCIRLNETCQDAKLKTRATRFRMVTHVNATTDDGQSVQQALTYEPDQPWPRIPAEVRFVKTISCEDIYERCSEEPALFPLGQEPDYEGPPPPIKTSANQLNHSSTHATDQEDIAGAADFRFSQPRTNVVEYSPSLASHHSHLYSPLTTSDTLSSKLSYNQSLEWPFKTIRESHLFIHFIKHLTPWVDICDPHCHFAREIPFRVNNNPILLNAIFACASRHLSIMAHRLDDESPRYASKCVQSLIQRLDDPLGHLDENLLAVVILLRLHEEISQEDDRQMHLYGQAKILNAISAFAADGGLRESGSWASLRQHIYVSLTKHRPLELDLANFKHSSVFREANNEAYANRIIYIFAELLNIVFSEQNSSNRLLADALARVESDIENWYRTKPWYYKPLWHEEQHTSSPQSAHATVSPNQARAQAVFEYPELIMAHPAQVLGYQYYHMARILLALYSPNLKTRLGFAGHLARKESERTVLTHVRQIIGLAKSNDDVINALLQASHILSACGCYIHNEEEKQAALDFLKYVQRQTGWKTERTVLELQQQWQD